MLFMGERLDRIGQLGRTVFRPPRDRARRASDVLSRALRALGRIERTLFTRRWLSDPALRQHSHAGLNKGEASNALRRAVFFHRPGEFRDRTFENQSFRAWGSSLITAAIVHRNTVYLDRAVRSCARRERRFPMICPCRTIRMGAHRPHRRLRLDRSKPRRDVSAATRGSFYVLAPF
jgi:Tn3 transposase DDE domain